MAGECQRSGCPSCVQRLADQRRPSASACPAGPSPESGRSGLSRQYLQPPAPQASSSHSRQRGQKSASRPWCQSRPLGEPGSPRSSSRRTERTRVRRLRPRPGHPETEELVPPRSGSGFEGHAASLLTSRGAQREVALRADRNQARPAQPRRAGPGRRRGRHPVPRCVRGTSPPPAPSPTSTLGGSRSEGAARGDESAADSEGGEERELHGLPVAGWEALGDEQGSRIAGCGALYRRRRELRG